MRLDRTSMRLDRKLDVLGYRNIEKGGRGVKRSRAKAL